MYSEVMGITRQRAIDVVISHARRHCDLLHFPRQRVMQMAGETGSIDELRLKCPSLIKKARSVEREAYKVKGYMRLVPLNALLVGTYKSRHVILDLVGLHFKKRYPGYHVITWNETRQEGCYSAPFGSGECTRVAPQLETVPVDGGFVSDLLLRGSLQLFRLPPGVGFTAAFLPLVVGLLSPGKEKDLSLLHDKREFEKQWAAFYDSQVVESRINYDRAIGLIGKRQLLDQLGAGSIEAQRVLKRVPKGQKTILDF